MTKILYFLIAFTFATQARAENAKRNIPYAEPANDRRSLDVYAPDNAKGLPVVFWIHGGGWQAGDKASADAKPKAFVDKGYVFVSTNYRLLPDVDMETIVRDVAKSIHWVHDHIAEYGGDPERVVVTGHSAGAQLAALICTDDRYLKAEGLTFAFIKGCIPVDGDTYDVPMMIDAGAARRKALGQPNPKFGHYEKFGSDPVKATEIPRPSTTSRAARAFRRSCCSTSRTIPTPARKPSGSARRSTKPGSPRSCLGPRTRNTPRSTKTWACPTTPRRRPCSSLSPRRRRSEIAWPIVVAETH